MSLQGIDPINFDSLTNTICLNFSTMGLSHVSTIVINSFISNLSDLTYYSNLSSQFWITMKCLTIFGLIINLLFIFTVGKTPSLQTIIHSSLTSLACSDCIY